MGNQSADQPQALKIDSDEQRKNNRVELLRGVSAQMMAIDGTWRRDCTMEDVSETGARLTVEGSVRGLNLKESFELLASTGLSYRRCQVVWFNGNRLGVSFLKQGTSRRSMRQMS